MANNALIQTRIDADVKEQAAAVLEKMGLTVSDAVRILLTRTAREGSVPMELLVDKQAYDAWFRRGCRKRWTMSGPTFPMRKSRQHSPRFGRRRARAFPRNEAGLVAARGR